jgi:hypothetical protein
MSGAARAPVPPAPGLGWSGELRARRAERAPPPPAHATGRERAAADGVHDNSEGSARPRPGRGSHKALQQGRRNRK